MKVLFFSPETIKVGLANGWVDPTAYLKAIAPEPLRTGLESGWLKPKVGDAYIAQCTSAANVEQLLAEVKSIAFDQVVLIIRNDDKSVRYAEELADVFPGKFTVLYGSGFSNAGILGIVGDATIVHCKDYDVPLTMVAILDAFFVRGELRVPVLA
jgi:hypothetical protein